MPRSGVGRVSETRPIGPNPEARGTAGVTRLRGFGAAAGQSWGLKPRRAGARGAGTARNERKGGARSARREGSTARRGSGRNCESAKVRESAKADENV